MVYLVIKCCYLLSICLTRVLLRYLAVVRSELMVNYKDAGIYVNLTSQ